MKMVRQGVAAVVYEHLAEGPYVYVSQRRTRKPGRWPGLLQLGFGGGVKPGEQPFQALFREQKGETPIDAANIKSIWGLGGVLAYVADSSFRRFGGGHPGDVFPPAHQGEPFNVHFYAVELHPGTHRLLNLEKISKADRLVLDKLPAFSPSGELSKPVLVPFGKVERLALDQPGHFMPHYLHAMPAVRLHLVKRGRIPLDQLRVEEWTHHPSLHNSAIMTVAEKGRIMQKLVESVFSPRVSKEGLKAKPRRR